MIVTPSPFAIDRTQEKWDKRSRNLHSAIRKSKVERARSAADK